MRMPFVNSQGDQSLIKVSVKILILIFLKAQIYTFKCRPPKLNLCITPLMCINLHLLPLYNKRHNRNFSFICQKANFASDIFFMLLCDADCRIQSALAASQSCAPQLRLKIDVQMVPTDFSNQSFLTETLSSPRFRVKILTCKINLNAWTNIIHKIQQILRLTY